MDLPPDPALGPVVLTDRVAVARLLAATVTAPVTAVRLRYLEHDVGASMLVHYRATVGGDDLDVVVSRHRRQWPAEPENRLGPEGVSPAPEELARAGVVRPRAVVDGVTVAWYPFDPGLPHLVGDPSRLVPSAVAGRSGPWRRLAWIPQQRAVLAAGAMVVKLEADPARVRAGVVALDLLRPAVTVPAVLAVDDEAGVFAQELLAGRPLGPPDAVGWAPAAGALAASVATIAIPAAAGLPAMGPAALLELTDPVVRLVAHAAPDLAARVAAVADQLVASAPAGPPPQPAHGDFNAGQLLGRADGTLGLVDTDTLCLAPSGYDLAAYAANLLAGRPGDLAACDAATAGLLQGFGERPPHLAWLLAVAALRRLDRPVRRYKSSWRRRLVQQLADSEALAARI